MTWRAAGTSLLVVSLFSVGCGGDEAAITSTLPAPAATTMTTLAAMTTVAAEQPNEPTATGGLGVDGVAGPKDGGPTNEAGRSSADYFEITDDRNSIVVSVPASWSDMVSEPWDHNGELVGPSLGAAPDYAAFLDGWDTPGVFIAASSELESTTAELLDFNDFSAVCEYVDRIDYDDGFYVGLMDVWEQCGGDSSFVVIAAAPPDKDYLTLIQLVIVSAADWDAADEVIRTFRVLDPNLP